MVFVNMAETAKECSNSSENEVKLLIVSFHSYLLLPIYVYGAGLSLKRYLLSFLGSSHLFVVRIYMKNSSG